MVAEKPDVEVYNIKKATTRRPGIAGRIALIGAFDTEDVSTEIGNPVFISGISEAYDELGTDETYNGVACIEPLFYGANGLIAVNITTKTGETVDKTLTVDKLTKALAKIKGENFDMLYVAESLTDEAITIIRTFLADKYEHKNPAGYVGAINRADINTYITTADLMGDNCYGLITQQLKVNDELLSLIQSGAYYCGVLAGLNVGNSMTFKQVPQVTGLSPEYSFEDNGKGLALLQKGITTFQCFDRENEKYIVVNSEQNNGLDLYINRVRDFVVKEFALHDFLGDLNETPTYSQIEQEIDRVKKYCIDSLNLLKDIEYEIEKEDAKCLRITINKLLFAGVITKIKVYINIEVE